MADRVEPDERVLEESAEDLYENAPCGYVSTDPDGRFVKANRTFLALTGYERDELVGRRRFQDLFTAAGRIYHETHYAPLLRMQGKVREIAVEIVRADGSRVPALLNSVLITDSGGRPRVIRTTVFEASDRRRYEEELLAAGRRERAIAEELQTSLLGGPLAAGTGFELEVAYRPAVTGLAVGGDWYDAFWIDEPERLALVVGDVVGRGIEAAATMGQLRSATRALASVGGGPAAVLGALDAFAGRHGVGQMATVVYAELEPAAGRLRWSCAGHPPPVVAEPGRPAVADWGGRSVPVDVPIGDRRSEAERVLAPGSLLLLYTDGLVERRTQPVQEGIARLLSELDERGGDQPLAAPVLEALRDPEHPDDVCLLVLRLAAA